MSGLASRTFWRHHVHDVRTTTHETIVAHHTAPQAHASVHCWRHHHDFALRTGHLKTLLETEFLEACNDEMVITTLYAELPRVLLNGYKFGHVKPLGTTSFLGSYTQWHLQRIVDCWFITFYWCYWLDLINFMYTTEILQQKHHFRGGFSMPSV